MPFERRLNRVLSELRNKYVTIGHDQLGHPVYRSSLILESDDLNRVGPRRFLPFEKEITGFSFKDRSEMRSLQDDFEVRISPASFYLDQPMHSWVTFADLAEIKNNVPGYLDRFTAYSPDDGNSAVIFEKPAYLKEDSIWFLPTHKVENNLQRWGHNLHLKMGETCSDIVGESPCFYTLTEKDGRPFLIISEVKAKNPAEKITLEKKKLSSYQEALDLLREDFPWLTAEDLFQDPDNKKIPHRFISQRTKTDKNNVGSLANFSDGVRIANLYGSDLDDFYLPTRDGRLTKFDYFYASARDFLYTIDLAVLLENNGHLKITETTPSQRREIYLRFNRDLQKKMFEIIKPRIGEETRLFGEPIDSNDYSVNITRFVKGDSMALQFININSNTLAKYARYYDSIFQINTAEVVKAIRVNYESVDRDVLIEYLAETENHEQGHRHFYNVQGDPNFDDTNTHKEIWNEWLNNVYPYHLSGGKRPVNQGSVSYHYTADDEKQEKLSGSYEIQNMYSELVIRTIGDEIVVDGQTIDEDYIRKSALLTGHFGREKGLIIYKNKNYMAFGTLFESVFGRKYDDMLKGCRDEDYEKKRVKRPTVYQTNDTLTAQLRQTFLDFVGGLAMAQAI